MTSTKIHNAKYELLPNIKKPKYTLLQKFIYFLGFCAIISLLLIFICFVYHSLLKFNNSDMIEQNFSLENYIKIKNEKAEINFKRMLDSNYTNDIQNENHQWFSNIPSDLYKLVCYFILQNEVEPLFKNLDPDLCTHLNVGFFQIENNTILVSNFQKSVLQKIQSFKSQNPSLKTLITIGGADAEGFPKMVLNHANRKQFIKSLVKIIREYNLNGVDLDWEFPAWDDAIYDKHQRQHFTQLLEEIRLEIYRQSDQHKFLLSVAVAPVPTIIDTAYDVEYMNNFVDYINVMCYDYHIYTNITPWTGINAPLYKSAKDRGLFQVLNINFTTDYWVSKGMNRSKIVVGLPTYGHSFKLRNLDNNGLWAPASGYGSVGVLGYIKYSEACEFINRPDTNVIFDLDSQSPYAYNGFDWISYENIHSLTLKTEYVKDNNFGGVMIFNLNSDDFTGKNCDKQRDNLRPNVANIFPLTHTVKNILFDDSL